MSVFNPFKSVQDVTSLFAMLGTVAVGSFGIGMNLGTKEDLTPQVKANRVAIDSMRVRDDSISRAIYLLDEKVNRVLCYVESQAEGINQIRCAR